MFWIAQKLLYTTRTRSGPARASRRRPEAGKSALGGTFGTRTGGGVCRVSWGFPHGLRLLRATTGIDTRRIQPLRTCNRGVAVPFWVCPRTRHAGAGTTGHLDQRPARRLSASGVAPACLAVTPVPWRQPHPSLRSTCRVSALLGTAPARLVSRTRSAMPVPRRHRGPGFGIAWEAYSRRGASRAPWRGVETCEEVAGGSR